MKLRAYHNPENVDESRVPDGWTFPLHPFLLRRSVCKLWWPNRPEAESDWIDEKPFAELDKGFTYIIPVNA